MITKKPSPDPALPRSSGQRQGGEDLFLALFDAGHFVVLILNGLFQGIVGDLGAQRDDGRASFVADHSLADLGQSLESLLHAGLTVAAHHTFNMQSLFHGVILLDIGSIFNGCGLCGDSGQGRSLGFGKRVVVLGAVQVEQVQPQSVADDAEARQAHGGRAEHRVQRQTERDEHTSGQRDADDIINERPEQVFVDVAQGCAAQADGGGHIGELGVHQHDISRIDGDIRARTNGDAGVGAGQCGRIVDAVADHGDLARFLKLADDGFLAVRQNARDDLIDARLSADGVCGALVVASQHHDPDAHILQFADGAGTVLFDGISHSDHTQQTARTAEVKRRLALVGKRRSLFFQCGGNGDFRFNKGRIAAVNLHAVQLCGQTVSGQSRKIGDFRRVDVCRLGVGENGLGQRVLALAFERGGQRQKLVFADTLCGQDVGHLGFAAGDGSGLIQRNDLRAARRFQRSCRLEQDAIFCTKAVADHDGDRRRQTQRAGAADDQHRNAAGQCIAELAAQQQPDDGGQHSDGNDRRNKETRHRIGDFCDGCFGGSGIADHLDDLGQRGVLADAGGFAAQEAGLVGGRRRDLVALGLVHRDALAGQGAFVHGAGTLQHDAVHGDVLAGADHKNVAFAYFCDGHADLFAVPKQSSRLGGELHQTFQGVRGLALGAGFQHLAHSDEGQDHGGRLEVELHHIVHDHLVIAVKLGVRHGEQGVGAPDEAGRGTQRHQRIHVGRAVDEAFEAVDEELLVDDHDDARQQQLNKAHRDVVAVEPVGERPAPHHMAHRKVHQNGQKDQRCDQPLFQFGGLVIRKGVQIGAGVRGGCRAVGFRAGPVASVLHGFDDGGSAGCAFHAHRIRQQADRAARDAGDVLHGLFHPGRAGRAAHAGNVVLFHSFTPEDA